MKGEFFYANGYTIANTRRLCQFYFGDFFIKATKNDKKLRFDIYISNKIVDLESGTLKLEDYVDLDHFNNFWNGKNNSNPVFNVMVGDFS
jgi:hypothetical protein